MSIKENSDLINAQRAELESRQKLTSDDVVFSITILEDNVEHLTTMISVENNPARRYGSKCVPSPEVAKLLTNKRDSLVRTIAWLRTKTERD